LKAGDSEDLETIFNTYSKKLYKVALRILGEAADTQEVIQDVFWIAFRKAQSFRGHLAQPLVDWADTSEEKCARREIQALVCSALQGLKPIDKSITVLTYLEELSERRNCQDGGPAVNVASRLESLTKEVKRSVLFSKTFVEMAGCESKLEDVGFYPLRVLVNPSLYLRF
jgi:hypothetical protein